MKHAQTYRVQTWKHVPAQTPGVLTSVRGCDDIVGVSLDAAREIARAHTLPGYTIRIMPDRDDWACDYTEVHTHGAPPRCGPFCQVVTVVVDRATGRPCP